MTRTGRRVVDRSIDTRPGQTMLLGILANLPIMLAFVLAPLLARGDPQAATTLMPGVLYVTPVLAAWSLVVFFRMPRKLKAHRGARIGLLLDGVALALWAMVAWLLLASPAD